MKGTSNYSEYTKVLRIKFRVLSKSRERYVISYGVIEHKLKPDNLLREWTENRVKLTLNEYLGLVTIGKDQIKYGNLFGE